ncbi:hypothetical protein [Candidatus Similichlamydia laticola]|uniref:Uncharacterized protein n=1 Tax=Candidatus Similichlamydia laticola TaxID=2170265 RepID=A0A369K9C1_9BACT|nr:hypothetical protein [Candidatus Similichlamydia laticola]RDB31189.1 hypothetical protein HAT2_00669 [Candidatus Similichlamydia laticola]
MNLRSVFFGFGSDRPTSSRSSNPGGGGEGPETVEAVAMSVLGPSGGPETEVTVETPLTGGAEERSSVQAGGQEIPPTNSGGGSGNARTPLTCRCGVMACFRRCYDSSTENCLRVVLVVLIAIVIFFLIITMIQQWILLGKITDSLSKQNSKSR